MIISISRKKGSCKLPVFSLLVALFVLQAVVVPTVYGVARGRPMLNAERTTFVADNGELLRGPFTSSEWGDPAPYAELAKMKDLGFNAVHLYGECLNINYPNGGDSPGYAASRIDSVVNATRDLGMYVVITIGNGANNGNHNREYALDFWRFYAPRYANETHVIYEIHNEPVAWGPPYSSANANPTGALEMNIDAYNIIRANAPDTPVLLFSYSVLGDSGGANGALTDIRLFNQSVFGTSEATWGNVAVGFHGYAGASANATAVEQIINAGYPCFMTEFATGVWGTEHGGIDTEAIGNLERLNVSWLAFHYVPPWGVADDVTRPEVVKDRIDNSGLSWTPDFGSWPVERSVFENGGSPRTIPGFNNDFLSGSLRIQAEHFDAGGNGVAYYNENGTNPGGAYRMDETVGIEVTTDSGGGYNVGWTASGDWLEYTMKVSQAGTYNLSLRVASTNAALVQIDAFGKAITENWALPNTGGLQSWTTVTKRVFLEPGQQLFRINVVEGGFNLNWMEFSAIPAGPVADGTYKFVNAASSLAIDVDAARTLKFEYYLIDDGWRNWGAPGKNQWECLEEVIDYAKSQGVKALVWVNSAEMRDAKSRRAYLEKVADIGAAGIKIDFIPPCTAEITRWYEGALQDTAELELLCNFHGSVKLTGRQRTWPHELTREAVRGHEYHMSRYGRVQAADHDTIVPFTRYLCGPADYTPTAFDTKEMVGYTWSHLLAQAVDMTSPLLHFAGKYQDFIGNPAEDLIRHLPATWDETIVLPGSEIGTVVGFARRRGQEWYIGVLNGGEETTLPIDLSFLGNGKWKAQVFADDPNNPATFKQAEKAVTARDQFEVPMSPRGGLVVWITK